MRRAAPLLAGLLLLAPVVLAAEAEELSGTIAKPVDLAFRADGRLFFAELDSGKARELRADGTTGASIVTLPSSPGGNGGFTGLAFDADGTAYVVYSHEKAGAPHGKVQRVSKVVDGRESVLLDDIPWAPFHVGGRIAIGPDGMLYVTTGDNGGPDGDDYTRGPGDHPDDKAQDPQSLIGKVLRMTKEGRAAGGVAGWDPYVHAMGFRNPFGLAFGPDGTLYAAENGIIEDEVDIIVAGGNYGWPACEGACGRSDVRDPLASWPSSGVTGIAYLAGKVYVGEFSDGIIYGIDIATGARSEAWRAEDAVLDVAAGADGCLYASSMSSVWAVDLAESGACRLGPAPPPPSPTPSPTPITSPSPSPGPAPSPSPSPGPAPEPTPTVPPSPTPAAGPPPASPEPAPSPAPDAPTPASAAPNATNVTPEPGVEESAEEEARTPAAGLPLALAAVAVALLGRRRR